MNEVAVLRDQARAAYERGRLQAAVRVGWVVTPVALICAWETGAPWRTAVLAVLLFALATAIRWRQVKGFSTVQAGLQSGAAPLMAALALCRFAPACPPDLALALCGGAGLVAGSIMGRGLGTDGRTSLLTWLSVATTGGLLATMGCLALGLGAAAGAAAGIATGAAVTALTARQAVA